ncbi:MAG: carboxypeptidase regulatory-like domain-containing protein, partial [Acidobacteria bacterium]|nr:carboxypeptidase regulatory-like domain-containing protein [Acidobacteriota bacterium]
MRYVRQSLLLLFICWVPTAAANLAIQSITGVILGTVTDVSGGLITGAIVTITSPANNQTTVVVTRADGSYQAPLLPPGNYVVKVSAQGFKIIVRDGVTLRVEDKLRLDFTLEAGAVTETVTVTGTPLIESETSSLGLVIEEQSVKELPIRGRNVFDLVGLSPGVQVNPLAVGVVASTGDNSAPLFVLSDISINGGRVRTNEYLLDGVTLVLPENNNYALSPTPDGTREFKVISNSYGPQFGRSGGGVINVVTKSGTNNYHATLFEQFRNQQLRANNFFANARGQKRGVFRFHQFGGTFGGPVIKEKTFFFADYQGHREVQYLAGRAITIPTDAQRRGDFRGLLNANGQAVTLYDPLTTRVQGSGFVRDPLTCNGVANVLCPNRIDPVAAKMLSFLPAPNRPGEGPAGINNFVFAPENLLSSNQWSLRMDHRVSERHNLFGRVTRNTGFNSNTGPFDNIADNVLGKIKHSAINFVLNDTLTLTPSRLLSTRFGFTRRTENRVPLSAGKVNLTDLGFPSYVGAAAQDQLFPAISITGFASLGSPSGDRINRANDIFAWVADLTEIRGAHTLNLGTDLRIYNQTPFQAGTPSGSYSFGPNFTQGPNPQTASLTAGNGLASFLLGYGSGSINAVPALAMRNYYLAFYANDAIKLGRLTLNLGLRWDYEQPRTERYNRLANFDFDAPFPIQVPGLTGLKGVLTHAGRNGEPRGNFDPANRNFGPRLGLAYRIDDKTAIRAGYGIFYLPRIGATSAGTIGVSGFDL